MGNKLSLYEEQLQNWISDCMGTSHCMGNIHCVRSSHGLMEEEHTPGVTNSNYPLTCMRTRARSAGLPMIAPTAPREQRCPDFLLDGYGDGPRPQQHPLGLPAALSGAPPEPPWPPRRCPCASHVQHLAPSTSHKSQSQVTHVGSRAYHSHHCLHGPLLTRPLLHL